MPTTTLAATTHVARDYTHLTKEALEEFAQSYNRDRVLPLNIEHDLTLPPVGKILRAWVAPLEDGEHGLFVEFDEFDQRGVISLPGGAELIVERSSSDQRPFISLHTTAPAQLDVAVDLANFATREDYQALFAALDAEVPFTRSTFGRRSDITDPQVIITLTKTIAGAILGLRALDKVQAKLGDEVADDVAKFYRLVSSLAVQLPRYAKAKNRPVTYVIVAPGEPVTEFVVRTTDPALVAAAIRDQALPKLAADMLAATSFLKPTRVQFLHVNGDWKLNYLLTHTGEAIGTEESYGRRARFIQLQEQAAKDNAS